MMLIAPVPVAPVLSVTLTMSWMPPGLGNADGIANVIWPLVPLIANALPVLPLRMDQLLTLRPEATVAVAVVIRVLVA